MNLWQCPHPALFLQDVFTALDPGQDHCVVSMPARLIPSFQEALQSLWLEHRSEILPVRLLDAETSLIDALAPLFYTDSAAPSLTDLRESTLMGAPTLAVVLPDRRVPAEDELFRFLKENLAVQAGDGDGAGDMYWNMLVLAPADREIPSADAGLKRFRWWGRLHSSDLEYAIEDTFWDSFGQGAGRDRFGCWWLYPICRGVAGGDPELVEIIHQHSPEDMDGLMDALATHELNTPENGRLVAKFLKEARRKAPPRSGRPEGLAAELWHRGVLDLNCEGEMSLHPAALLAAGRRDELEKLVMLAQMQFFLPLVQEVHKLLRRHVEHYPLGDCDLGEYLPRSELLNAALYEIGPFCAMLGWLYQERGLSPRPCVVAAAHVWRDLRNEIAHFRMLPRQTVREALDLYEKLLSPGGAEGGCWPR